MFKTYLYLVISLFPFAQASASVSLGCDTLFTAPHGQRLRGKRVGLLTNQTGVDRHMESTIGKVKRLAGQWGYELTALYSPEHGLYGAGHAEERIAHSRDLEGIPIFSLFGKTKRPSPHMFEGVDIILYDLQDIGSRSYTYVSTLFFVMEEAAKLNKKVIILDRPNPINGLIVDGPMMEEKWRSIVGYIDVPYCHGMTVGELARFFNEEYQIRCPLEVIPMAGWKRSMTFQTTGLTWIPTSPHIPEPDTPFFYPTTGILGELQMVNIGVGYTLPFKVVGAPWIDADTFALNLNKEKLPGVRFHPFHFKPFYGRFKGMECQGVRILVTNPSTYRPVTTQFLLMGTLKALYPSQFKEAFEKSADRREMFAKVNGTDEVYQILQQERYPFPKLKALHEQRRKEFLKKRRTYLNPSYG